MTADFQRVQPAPFAHAAMPEAATTCVVVDEHAAIRDALERSLGAHRIQVVGRVARVEDALDEVERRCPDLVVLDASTPLGAVELARRLLDRLPRTAVVLYTVHRDAALAQAALAAGVRGVVLKSAALEELARAARLVLVGRTYVDPELVTAVTSPETVVPLLTTREREVLSLLADGFTNDKVAARLGISPETVQTHVGNAMAKLDASTRTEAVATALRRALIA
jgi:DNA-binding NarL/FixJ family response regulator